MKEIFFASDEGYVAHLAVAIQSMLENSQGAYCIKVINSGIGINDWTKLERLVGQHEGCSIRNCYFNDSLLNGVKTGFHFNKSNYYRLFIPEFAESSKVLYLDADIVVDLDIGQIFDYDFSGHYIAAVENPGFNDHDRLLMDTTAGYFNSGVMLINIEKWKKESLAKKVIDFVNAQPEKIKFVDQCGLNAIINGEWLKIPPKFNQQTCFFESGKDLNCYASSEVYEAKKKPVVVHYTGSFKPWHFGNDHPFKERYWYYRSKTEFRTWFSDDFKFYKLIKLYTPSFIKRIIQKTFKLK